MNECCEKLENRETVEIRGENGEEKMVVQKCTVCGRKHYELTVDPGVLGLRGGQL